MVTHDLIGAGRAPDAEVLVVGTGHGGAQAAIALRHKGFSGTIAMVGAELELPYERPPLTKLYLSGAKQAEDIRIRSPAFWREQQIAELGLQMAELKPQITELEAALAAKQSPSSSLVGRAGPATASASVIATWSGRPGGAPVN